jgi:hypothetical protein
MRVEDEDALERLVSLTGQSLENVAHLRDCLGELSRSADDPVNRHWQIIRQTFYLQELECSLAAIERRVTGAAVH